MTKFTVSIPKELADKLGSKINIAKYLEERFEDWLCSLPEFESKLDWVMLGKRGRK
ncbi:MAG: hypothetical protein QME12_07260 [Nanoarchaeota archaeon]|nr:hypothetical protein [Nanoarchaeota archaeon]